jgi:TolB protein
MATSSTPATNMNLQPRESRASRRWYRGRRVALVSFSTLAAAVLAATTAGASQAAFSGENGRIAFASNLTGSQQIYSMRPDGSDVRQLTHTSSRHNSVNADWSPDGRWIAFDSDRTGPVEIFIMRSDGRDVRQVTHLSLSAGDPSWSPDGTRLVFDHFSNGGFANIYSIRPDGSDLKELTHFTTQTNAFEPEYSPNGAWIAFQQSPTGNPPSAIYVMRSNGNDLHRVTPLRMDADHPEWSPDGSLIIFNNHASLNIGDIFTIHPDGDGITQLTHVARLNQADFRADFSPDGKKIVFDQFIPGQPLQVAVMNTDGSGTKVINTDSAFAPDWGPAPED